MASVRRGQGCPVLDPTKEAGTGEPLSQAGGTSATTPCIPWRGSTSKQFFKNCSPWERPHTGAGQQSEEGTAKTKCYTLTTTLLPQAPATTHREGRGRRGRSEGVKVSLGRPGERKMVLVLSSFFHYPTLFFKWQ